MKTNYIDCMHQTEPVPQAITDEKQSIAVTNKIDAVEGSMD
jgi:hypothetical protein